MRKINAVYAAILLFCGCSTMSGVSHKLDLDIGTLESINLGSDAKSVSDSLGQPSEKRKSKSQPAAESWIYDDVDGAQRGTVEIDSESQKVRAVMIIPRELESEFKVSYLLEKKFKDSSFEKMPLQICSRDSIPPQIYYVDSLKGILIIANKHTGEVEAFSRIAAKAANEIKEKIKTCKL